MINLYSCRSVNKPFPLRIIRNLVRHVKYFLGLRFEVSGWEHLQTEGPYVIISNHQSSLDVLGGYWHVAMNTPYTKLHMKDRSHLPNVGWSLFVWFGQRYLSFLVQLPFTRGCIHTYILIFVLSMSPFTAQTLEGLCIKRATQYSCEHPETPFCNTNWKTLTKY